MIISRFRQLLIGAFIVLTSSIGLTYFTPANAYGAIQPCEAEDAKFLSFPRWNRGLMCEDKGSAKEHVYLGEEDLPKLVWTVALNGLDILLRIAGILAVAMMIYDGYLYLTSGGVPDKITKAKTGLIRATVGLAIAIMSTTIIYFIVDWI